ncbi:MAG: COX15/CtaA family protein [Bryobacterales bacterium]|nr:COX15/CtaA family protein [Acidobacteriota bacterium]MCB9385017.1 COX15/CtaA family protein [Bryobacterales bacterium]
MSATNIRFARYAWFFTAYLIVVILFGAWVRITHSGAGCGSHWPTCNGEIVPPAPSLETMIEYTHRLTSGLCGLLGLLLAGWAARSFGASSAVFRAAAATFVFLMIEAGIGAGIVLRELVADNDSVMRAVAVSIHLTNTLLLTGFSAYTAWLASGGRRGESPIERGPGALTAGLLALVAMSMAGAVTALGDTLFPIEPALGPGLLDKVSADLSAANHFLVRLRALHPFVAVAGAAYLAWLFWPGRREGWSRAALMALAVELAIGLANIALAAPGWMQLVHLAVAHVVWIATVLASLEAVAAPHRATAAAVAARA